MTTNTFSKFHQNPSRSVKWFLYNSLHIYRESLLTTTTTFTAATTTAATTTTTNTTTTSAAATATTTAYRYYMECTMEFSAIIWVI